MGWIGHLPEASQALCPPPHPSLHRLRYPSRYRKGKAAWNCRFRFRWRSVISFLQPESEWCPQGQSSALFPFVWRGEKTKGVCLCSRSSVVLWHQFCPISRPVHGRSVPPHRGAKFTQSMPHSYVRMLLTNTSWTSAFHLLDVNIQRSVQVTSTTETRSTTFVILDLWKLVRH